MVRDNSERFLRELDKRLTPRPPDCCWIFSPHRHSREARPRESREREIHALQGRYRIRSGARAARYTPLFSRTRYERSDAWRLARGRCLRVPPSVVRVSRLPFPRGDDHPALSRALHPAVPGPSDCPVGQPHVRSTSSRIGRVGAASTPWSPAPHRRNRREPQPMLQRRALWPCP